jgi:dihydroxy-acid dehydratase
MGTALTMAMMAEVLGIMLPGAATLAHDDPHLDALAGDTGRRIVAMIAEGVTAAQFLTRESFERALRVLAALGGSTNAVLHLCAIAGRRRLGLTLQDFDRAARDVPVLADVAPIGTHNIAAFDAAGGVAAVVAALDGHPTGDGTVVRRRTDPVSEQPALAVLTGNLAPDGALVKTAAADPHLSSHTGPAVVFDSYEDMVGRIDDPNLDVDADSVLVLRGCGPRGGDGFPEWGMIPIPKKLAERGVTDMVRVSDARMSGTSFGMCILHVAPEAAVGGPLAALRTGDVVTVDVATRRLSVDLTDEELTARLASWTPPAHRHSRGWPALYQQHVMQAPEGADLDFLVPTDDAAVAFVDPVVGRS